MKTFMLISTLFLLTACGKQTDVEATIPAIQETEVKISYSPSPSEITDPAQPTATQPLPATQPPATSTSPPPSPIPPTFTPIPKVYAIIDGATGFLIGGSRDGVWLSADMTAPYISDGEEYRLFNTTEFLGTGIGKKAETIENGPCTRNYTVQLDPNPEFLPGLVIGGSWDVAPRTTTRLGHIEVYKDAIEDILIEQGITNPEAAITSILRVDLEGDGIDEVLITATHMASGGSLPPVTTGDYSLIVLRKLIDGDVVTIPLALDVYLESETLAYPMIYTIGGVYDLNGDGRLEVVLEGQRWEGRSVSVFEIEEGTAIKVLGVSCTQ